MNKTRRARELERAAEIDTTLLCMVHTVEITADNIIDTQQYPYITSGALRHRNSERYKYRLNILKAGENAYRESGVNAAIQKAITETGMKNAKVTRIDYAIDSINTLTPERNYDSLYKVNRIVLSMLALRENIKNVYNSEHGIFGDKLSFKIEKTGIAAEYYNKPYEEWSNDRKSSGTTGRFECRATDLQSSHAPTDRIVVAELSLWQTRLTDLTEPHGELYTDLCLNMNEYLIEEYHRDQSDKPRWATFNEFLAAKGDRIFNRRQLKDLYRRMGYEDPEKQASRFKRAHKGIEFYSLNQIKQHIADMWGALEIFTLNYHEVDFVDRQTDNGQGVQL